MHTGFDFTGALAHSHYDRHELSELEASMATAQGAGTARERLRRISSTFAEPSVITLRDNTVSQDNEAHIWSTRQSTDVEQGLRAPLLSPFADSQTTPVSQTEPGTGADLPW